MSRVLKGMLLALVISLSATTAMAAGSGAYRVDLPDARALSMGGAFVAVADSPAAVFYNPAGMTQLKTPEVSVNLSFIKPIVNAYPAAGDKIKMNREEFLVPGLFAVTPINDKVAFGVGATSSWGLATEWPQDSFARYVSTRTKLQNQDYLITTAYKVDDQLSLGVGATIDYSTVEKQRKINQFVPGVPDANFKLEGDNTAAGWQVSAMYKLNEKHQFGIQYASEIRRKYHGKVYLDGLNNAALGAALGFDPGFTGSSYETDAVSKAVLPQSVDLGYAYKATDKLTLTADIMWMDLASTKKEEIAFPNETNPGTLAFLSIGNPANKDWHSALSLGLGAEYLATERLRLRSGYFFHQSPINQDTWEPCLPDANSHSVALGAGFDVTKALTFDLAYSAMFYDTRTISNTVGDASFGSIDGKYTQWTNLVLATLTYKF